MSKFIERISYEKVFLYLIILFAFTLPLSRAAVSLFVVVLPIIWIIQGDLKEKFKYIITNKLLLSLLMLIIWSILAMSWSDSLPDAVKSIRMIMYLVVIFVIATSISKEDITCIVTAFLLGMFVSEMIAYGVFFELWTFKHATPSNPSPFMIHIDYSVFLAFSSILLLNRIFSKHYSKKERIVFFFFFLTVTGNLFLATGRTGQVSLIAAIIVLSIIHFKFNIKSMFISLALLFVVFFSAYNLSDSFVVRVDNSIEDVKRITKHDLNGSWGIRLAFWIITYDSFKENPFGSGLGDYKEAITRQLRVQKYSFLNEETKKFMSNMHPHNQYLLLIIEMGFIGLLLYLNIIYQLLVYKIKDKEIKELSILFIIVYAVGSLAEPLLFKQFTLVLFILFIGLFTVSESKNNEVEIT